MVRASFPSIFSSRRFFGTAMAALLLAGSLNIAGVTLAQAESQEACVASCKTEKEKCLSQMGTAEMCGADQKICEKACAKN